MYEGIAILKKEIITKDKYLNEVKTYIDRQVFVKPQSIYANEFYQAASSGLKPSIKLVISTAADYDDEKLVEYERTLYSVIRVYRHKDSIELTCEEKIGIGNGS